MIKKICLLVFLSLFISSHAFCDTIFVYIGKGEVAESINLRLNELVNSLESGVMDSFFNNGHIVFSDNSAVNQFDSFEKLNQLAKRGGANILITADMNLQHEGGSIIVSGEYSVYNLFNDNVIYYGDYKASENKSLSHEEITEKFFDTGKSIGDEVVRTLF